MKENLECCSMPRDYEGEINQLKKELYCLHEEIEKQSEKNKLLEKSIGEMNVKRYVFEGR